MIHNDWPDYTGQSSFNNGANTAPAGNPTRIRIVSLNRNPSGGNLLGTPYRSQNNSDQAAVKNKSWHGIEPVAYNSTIGELRHC